MNAFTALAERQVPSPVKARQRAIEKRRANQERADEDQKLRTYYWIMRRIELADALASDDGARLQSLLEQLDATALDTIHALDTLVRTADWHSAERKVRWLAQRLTSERIIELREAEGLVPFDDPLPGDPATPEQLLRDAFADHPGAMSPETKV